MAPRDRIQSERRDIYREHVKMLLDAVKAYIAFDTPEELDAKRKEIANFPVWRIYSYVDARFAHCLPTR